MYETQCMTDWINLGGTPKHDRMFRGQFNSICRSCLYKGTVPNYREKYGEPAKNFCYFFLSPVLFEVYLKTGYAWKVHFLWSPGISFLHTLNYGKIIFDEIDSFDNNKSLSFVKVYRQPTLIMTWRMVSRARLLHLFSVDKNWSGNSNFFVYLLVLADAPNLTLHQE